MKPETVQTSLGALKALGSIQGVIFAKEDQIVYTDSNLAREKVEQLVTVVDDIWFYFKKENRKVDQVAFGYDGGSLVVVVDEGYRLVLFHSNDSEIDFIAKSGKAFLIDYQVGLFAEELSREQDQQKAIESVSAEPKPLTPEQVRQQTPHRPGTQRITLKAEKGFSNTQPIQQRPQPSGRPTARGGR